MKYLSRTLPKLSLLSGFTAGLLASPLRVLAQPQDWTDECQFNGVATIKGFECIVGNVLAVAVTFIGLIGFVMLLVGSFLYLTSGGNSNTVGTAQKTFTYAIIGLIVAVLSMFALNFISAFTGVRTILDFNLTIR